MIDFKLGHTGVVGRTREGKTYTTFQELERDKRAILFFNTQHETKVPGDYLFADGQSSAKALFRALKDGEKINFLPSTHLPQATRQLAALINALYDGTEHNMILVVDEAHLYKKEALDALMRVSTTGLRWGITLVPITQRLAKMHNDLMTQLIQTVVFATNAEGPYFKSYGIPHEEIERRIWSMPKITDEKGQLHTYAYCVWDGREVHGPFKHGMKQKRGA